ncbi:multicopper oxidase family protein [Nocardiopsis mwathae]|uniref:multicopper oxidase family protein n=1 Tax=Nocardiopsis mwathae TaxID=1472723 RepID=UPI001FE8AEF4|nr:multicopper oxidase family protein [Nocardiopsis mwathae]
MVRPTDDIIDAVEEERPGTGRERTFGIRATESELTLGRRSVPTWSYGDALPGEALRLTAGDTLLATLHNRLPEPTSIHWHGLAMRNDMDGAPPATQKAIPPGGEFTYRFIADTPGTHWFHPHVGTQLDRGLYAPIIVDDPREPLSYDEEWIVMLDDWLDGIDSTPDDVLAAVRPDELDGEVVHATDLAAEESVRLEERDPEIEHRIELTGGMADYDWAINGRAFDHGAPTDGAFEVRQGQRARFTFVNSTEMWHPMHLHGHTFQVGPQGPRKDTLIVLPGQSLACDFDATKPGLWLVHCHNLYHGEAGMMGLLAYTA